MEPKFEPTIISNEPETLSRMFFQDTSERFLPEGRNLTNHLQKNIQQVEGSERTPRKEKISEIQKLEVPLQITKEPLVSELPPDGRNPGKPVIKSGLVTYSNKDSSSGNNWWDYSPFLLIPLSIFML